MPALFFERDEMGLRELRQMAAGRLRAHPRMPGQLACRQGAPVGERLKDIGAGRIADQGRDLGEAVAGNDIRHGMNIDLARQVASRKQFGHGRSILRRRRQAIMPQTRLTKDIGSSS